MTPGREDPVVSDPRTVAALVLLNVAVHFVPLARPGFQPDDFSFLHLSRMEPAGSFVDATLSRATRPLSGLLSVLLLPRWLCLTETGQLAVLIVTTSLLTALVSVLLNGLLPRRQAQLAGLAFVLWPVKHEIYASQLFGVINLAASLILGAALCYRRYLRMGRAASLAIGVLCYGLSIFTYELGYLGPLVFVAMEKPGPRRLRGAAWFLMPAIAYWVVRFVRADVVGPGGGNYPLALESLATNLVTGLPSNLVGFQVARNLVYGLWGVVMAPGWFQLWCFFAATLVGGWALRCLRDTASEADLAVDGRVRVFLGLLCAALLMAPAAVNLIESRHSVLAAVGMAVVMATSCSRLGARLGTAIIVTLLLATQGLASRQAEVSRLQASVRDVIRQQTGQIQTASSVVIDIASLADRIPFTFRPHDGNVLRAYWGMQAFTAGGLRLMIEDALYTAGGTRTPLVRTCARGLTLSAQSVACARDFAGSQPFELSRAGALIIDFKTMPIPK
jgi:hypothetical protein